MIFSINNRFELDTQKNTLTDKSTNQVQHLEYRLMAVLQLLIDAKGEIVERDRIIHNVWNNYPGGDEGLNQAVSHLRKYFEDSKKEIIKTIPKKGYILTGTVAEEKKEAKAKESTKQGFNRIVLLLLITGIALISFLIYQHTQAVKNGSSDEPFSKYEHLRKSDSAHQAETLKKYKEKK
jgi:DNA-binding winged helix-turn-helix (wHTH) protein